MLTIEEDYFSEPLEAVHQTSITTLQNKIAYCQTKIKSFPPESKERKQLIDKLVELREQLSHLVEQDSIDKENVNENLVQVFGHKFEQRGSIQSKRYCECCASLIWNILQASFCCQNCNINCHDKCLMSLVRTCASVRILKTPNYILDICPQKGLDEQKFGCAECHRAISFQNSSLEARICDYTGLYYCAFCHWNDTMIIPARVLSNWDFEPRKVCRATKQLLKLMVCRPVLCIKDINITLFSLVDELKEIKRLREEIIIMKTYFLDCKVALRSKLLLQLQSRQHFVDGANMFSLQDLVDTNADILLPWLAKVHASFSQHIKTDCEECQKKGSMCRMCDSQEVLFPFDSTAIACSKCSSYFHRYCYAQQNQQCNNCKKI